MQKCDICDTLFEKRSECPTCGSNGYNDQECITNLKKRGYVFGIYGEIIQKPQPRKLKKEINMNDLLPEGTLIVSTTTPVKIKGKIVGYTSDMPVIGRCYIIQITESDIDKTLYPYSCTSLFRTQFDVV